MRTFKLYELFANQIPSGAMIAIDSTTGYTYIFRYNGAMVEEDRRHSLYSFGVDRLKAIRYYKRDGIMKSEAIRNSRLFVLLNKSKYINTNIRFATQEEIELFNKSVNAYKTIMGKCF